MIRPARLVAITAVSVALVTWWLATSPVSPVNPTPPRPIVTALAKLIRTAARLGLWVALAAEESPRPKDDRPRIVQAVDAQAIPSVDHAEGW